MMTRRILVAATAALLVAACGSDGAAVSAGSESSPPPVVVPSVAGPCAHRAPADSPCTHGDPRPGSDTLADAAHSAEVALTGTVTAVSAPRWNSSDGLDWTSNYLANADPPVSPAPIRYRLVTVKVDQLLFSTPNRAALLGKDSAATVFFYGDGTNTGANLGTPPGRSDPPSVACIAGDTTCTPDTSPRLRFNDQEGPVAVGDHVMFLLETITVRMEDAGADWPALTPADAWVGNLRLQGDGRYHNIDPRQAYTPDEVVATITRARTTP